MECISKKYICSKLLSTGLLVVIFIALCFLLRSYLVYSQWLANFVKRVKMTCWVAHRCDENLYRINIENSAPSYFVNISCLFALSSSVIVALANPPPLPLVTSLHLFQKCWKLLETDSWRLIVRSVFAAQLYLPTSQISVYSKCFNSEQMSSVTIKQWKMYFLWKYENFISVLQESFTV